MIKAVVFDLDDTLAPEYGYVLSGFEALAPALACRTGLDEAEVFDRLKALFEKGSKCVFNRFFEELSITPGEDEIRELVLDYRDHEPGRRYRLYPDALPALKGLRDSGLGLGILTDGFAAAQRKKLKALDIEGFFDVIAVTGELGDEYKKPGAKGFEHVASSLGVRPEEMAYVGDNPAKDFFIKKVLGVTTVRIRRERGVYLDTPYLEDVREDHAIDSLSQLEDLFCIPLKN